MKPSEITGAWIDEFSETLKEPSMTDWEEAFIEQLSTLGKAIHETALEKGFWDTEIRLEEFSSEEEGSVAIKQQLYEALFAQKLMLIVTELSEICEGRRTFTSGLLDEHCSDFTNVEIEAADIAIRLIDFCEYRGLRLGKAIIAKMAYNRTRPKKHGKAY